MTWAPEVTIEDEGTVVESLDCGCVIHCWPDGNWADSGCGYHLPHHGYHLSYGEGEPVELVDEWDLDEDETP